MSSDKGEEKIFFEIMNSYVDEKKAFTKKELYDRIRKKGSPDFYVYGAIDNLIKTGFMSLEWKLTPTPKALHFFERFHSSKKIVVRNIPQDDIFNYPLCGHCGKPLLDTEPLLCEGCISGISQRIIDHYFIDGRSVGRYIKTKDSGIHSELSRRIIKFKRQPDKVSACEMARYMYEYIKDERYFLENIDCLIPLPDFAANGYLKKKEQNPGKIDLVSAQLSELLGIPAMSDVLVKVAENKKQKSLKLTERIKNVKGVFAVNSKDKIKNKSIILIDDIITSSSTINEASRVLLEGSARIVRFFTVGHTITQRGETDGCR